MDQFDSTASSRLARRVLGFPAPAGIQKPGGYVITGGYPETRWVCDNRREATASKPLWLASPVFRYPARLFKLGRSRMLFHLPLIQTQRKSCLFCTFHRVAFWQQSWNRSVSLFSALPPRVVRSYRVLPCQVSYRERSLHIILFRRRRLERIYVIMLVVEKCFNLSPFL